MRTLLATTILVFLFSVPAWGGSTLLDTGLPALFGGMTPNPMDILAMQQALAEIDRTKAETELIRRGGASPSRPPTNPYADYQRRHAHEQQQPQQPPQWACTTSSTDTTDTTDCWQPNLGGGKPSPGISCITGRSGGTASTNCYQFQR